MIDPIEEIKRLTATPVDTKHGGIWVQGREHERPSVRIDLRSFPERSLGSIFMFSPEEWVRMVEIMREYFRRESVSS